MDIIPYAVFAFSLFWLWRNRGKLSGDLNACGKIHSRLAFYAAFSLTLVGFGMSLGVLKASYGGFIGSAVVCMAVYLLLILTLTRLIRGRIKAVAFIMAVSLLLHIVAIRLTHANCVQSMFSDFAGPQSCMLDPNVTVFHNPVAFYWCNYEFICSILGNVFGRDIIVGQLLNAICCVMVIPPVFAMSERIGGFFMACFTSLLMGTAPGLLVYGTLLTSEFIAAVFYIYFFYFMQKTFDDASVGQVLIDSAIAGLFLGLGQLFKPLFIVFACAMIAVLIVVVCCRRKAKIALLALTCSTICLVSWFSSNVAQTCLAELAKPNVVKQECPTATIRTLLIGLHVESTGMWYPECGELPTTMPELRNLLKKNIRRDLPAYPLLFWNKFKIEYSNLDWSWWYDKSISPKASPAWLPVFICIFHKAFWLLFMMGAAGMMIAMFSPNRDGVLRKLLLLAVLEAFTAGVLIAEMQPRYKAAIYPIFFLVIPYARIWFAADNPLYRFLGSKWRGMSKCRWVSWVYDRINAVI